MNAVDEEIGYISVFDKPLSGEEYELLFSNDFPNIVNNEIKEKHIYYENKIIDLFENLFKLNGSMIDVRLYYLENSDLGIDEDNLYSKKDKNKLKEIFSSLSGKEIFYEKIFQLKTIDELKVLLKLQLRTSRTIDFLFENFDFMLKGSYEYIFNIFGNVSEEDEIMLCHKNGIYFKRF